MRLWLSACSFLLLTHALWAAAPSTIAYQGVLTDDNNQVVGDGNHSLTFALYTTSSGGSALWTETQTVSTTRGVFTAVLGSVTALNISFDQSLWLGITISGGSELSPRVQLAGVPYSMTAQGVADNAVTSAKIADGTVASADIADGTLTSTDIADGTVASADIADGTVASADITDATIATADLADNAVTAAKISDGTITAADIASAQVVKSVNSLTDAVTLAAGSNVTIAPSGNTLTIAASASGGNTLDQAYDQGGSGSGRTITADNGAVDIQGTGGLRVAGAVWLDGTSGSTPASGAGTRMMWIPAKAAFRAGVVTGTQWDDANIGTNSTVGGGLDNIASSGGSTVAGGQGNYAHIGSNATVGGGNGNVANNSQSTIAGGLTNSATGVASFVGGGGSNTAGGGSNTVVAGGFNNTASGTQAAIGGGNGNTASGQYATVAGGQGSTASGDNATIAGGETNTSTNSSTTVGGGTLNNATGVWSTVAGGRQHTASGSYSTVAGGFQNTASGNNSFVGGGESNTASALDAVVPGGRDNVASGDYSFAAGRRAKANHNGAFVWGDQTDADFASTAVDQFLIRASGGVGIGTNAPTQTLTVKGSGNTSSSAALNIQNSDGNTGLYVRDDQRVGIGYTAPDARFAIKASADNTMDFLLIKHDEAKQIVRIGQQNGDGTIALYDAGLNSFNHWLEGNAGSQSSMAVLTSSKLGVGTSTPGEKLDVEEASATVAAFNRTTDDGTIISLQQDGTEEGTISVSATTISYNAFTGSHYAWTDAEIAMGTLVALTGDNRRLHDAAESEILYGIAPSIKANDPAILGAYLQLQETTRPAGADNPHLVMAVGNGQMWVAYNGADIAIGDYLVSADLAGHAMKDPGTYETSYIVARAAESVQWSEVDDAIKGRKRAKISVFFESFARDNAQQQIENLRAENLQLRAQLDRLTTAVARLEALAARTDNSDLATAQQ